MRYSEFTEAFDVFLKQLIGKEPGGLASFGLPDLTKKDSEKGTEKPGSEKDGAEKGKPNNSDVKNVQDTDFDKKLVKVAQALGMDPGVLRAIIKFETAGTFSPKSADPWGVSVGLIGFTEQTAKGLGTSKAALAKMSAVEQLDYVYLFYKRAGIRSGDDIGIVYMKTFMPAFAYASDSIVLGKKGGGTLMLPSGKSSGLSMDAVWRQNPAFGKTRGRDSFTVGDVKSFARSRYK